MNDVIRPIVEKLKEERASVQSTIDRFTKERSRIDEAISALTGDPAPSGTERDGPTVPEMVEAAIRKFVADHKTAGLGLVFDYANILAEAQALYPGIPKLKTGLYTAFAFLAKKNKIRRAQGGFELLA